MRTERICTDEKAAKKFFGGDAVLTRYLSARITTLRSAVSMDDLIKRKDKSPLRLHMLHNKGNKRYKGCFAIDLKTIREPWRIIFEPLDDNREPFDEPSIYPFACKVRIIEIMEISKHYE